MSILNPTIDGWRSPDGYSFTMRTGALSKRLIGELVAPDGSRHILLGGKRETHADVLGRAELEIQTLRAGGQI